MFISRLFKILTFSLVVFPFASQAMPQNYQQALEHWQAVLSEYVNEKGETDFISLANNRQDLDAFVAYIEAVSLQSHPALFPNSQDVLAYHINTYNALAMHGVLERDIPNNFSSFRKRLSFFKLRSVVIGGDKTNLYDYENKVIRPLDEPRSHFALNCMVKDCPRLPMEVFTAGQLEQQLEALTWEFFSNPKHLQIDDQEKVVRVSRILKFYTKDFVASGKKSDLTEYINRYLESPVPSGYKVKFMDYDWTVNQSQ